MPATEEKVGVWVPTHVGGVPSVVLNCSALGTRCKLGSLEWYRLVVVLVLPSSRTYGLMHIARHVIQRGLNPRVLVSMASCDVASNV